MSFYKQNAGHKYGMNVNGSKLEKAVGEHLRLLEAAGELRDIREQVRVRVCCKGECCSKMAVYLIVDFSAVETDTGETVYIEAKGFETPEWRIKRRMWMHNGPGLLRIYKGTHRRFDVAEEIGAR